MKQPYVLTYKNEVVLVGPFPDIPSATRYGNAWAFRQDDDPRWNVVHLEKRHVDFITAARAYERLGVKP